MQGSGNSLIDDLLVLKMKKQHRERVRDARNSSLQSSKYYIGNQPHVSHREAKFRNTSYIQEQKDIERTNKFLYNSIVERPRDSSPTENPLLEVGDKITFNKMNSRRLKMKEIERQNLSLLKRLENVPSSKYQGYAFEKLSNHKSMTQ